MISLEELGLTKEELQNRVIDKITESVLGGFDSEGDWSGSGLQKHMDKMIQKTIEDAVRTLGDKHVLPIVTERLESLCIQQTNNWGEKKGGPVSFVEYLVQRADHYMQEGVNSDGRGKEESGNYNWSKDSSRITYLVNKHIHYNIETAMKTIIKDANKTLTEGLAATVKIQLEDIAKRIAVNVNVK